MWTLKAEFCYLLRLTVGLLFLSSPFRGSKMQFIADIIIQFMTPTGSYKGIIKSLNYDDLHYARSCTFSASFERGCQYLHYVFLSSTKQIMTRSSEFLNGFRDWCVP